HSLDRWLRAHPTFREDLECATRIALFETHAAQGKKRGLARLPALARVDVLLLDVLLGLLPLDVRATEGAFGHEPIVTTAPYGKIRCVITSSKCARLLVVEFEKGSRVTTAARLVDEGALFPVPFEHLASDRARDVTAPRALARCARSRSLCLTESLLFELREE